MDSGGNKPFRAALVKIELRGGFIEKIACQPKKLPLF